MDHHTYAHQAGYRVSANTKYETLCPFCQHENRKFYISIAEGLYKCFHCNKGGKWANGQDAVGQPLPSSPAISQPTPNYESYVKAAESALHTTAIGRQNGLNYLINRRNLTLPIIKFARLGYDAEKDAVVIPHYASGNLQAVELRFINSDQRYQTLPGGKKVLYNADYVRVGGTSIAICEGVFDCLSSLQMIPNLPAVALPGNSVFNPAWKEMFSKYEQIYLLYDMTAQSEQFIEKWMQIIKPYKLYRPVFPAKDINELLVNSEDSTKLYVDSIVNAKRLGRPLIASVGDLIPAAMKLYGSETVKYPTGFESLDKISGGMRPGELTVLMADTGRGKTTLATALTANMANQNIKSLVGSFEVSNEGSILPKTVSFLSKRNVEIDRMPQEQFRTVLKALDTFGNIKFIDRTGVTPLDEIVEAIELGYSQGIRFVMLDHLHYFIKPDKDERLHIVTAMKTLKALTKKHTDLMILLVVHPSKPPKDMKTGLPLRLTMHNAKGSADIFQETDNFWVLNYDYSEQIVDITVEKLRADKVNIMPGGNAKVYFDKLKFSYMFV